MNVKRSMPIFWMAGFLALAGCDNDRSSRPEKPIPNTLEELCQPYCLQKSSGLRFKKPKTLLEQIDEAVESSEQKDEINDQLMSDANFSGDFSFAIGAGGQEAYVNKIVNRLFHVSTPGNDSTSRTFLVLGFTTGDIELVELYRNKQSNYNWLPRLQEDSLYGPCYDNRDASQCKLSFRVEVSLEDIVGDDSTILPITAINGYLDLATGGKLQLFVGYGNETLNKPASVQFNIFKFNFGFTVGGKTAKGGGVYNIALDLDDVTALPLIRAVDPNSSSDDETKAVTNIYVFTNVFKAEDTDELVLDAGILFARDDESLASPVVLSDIGVGGYTTRNHAVYKVLNAAPAVDRDSGGLATAINRKPRQKYELNEVLLSTLDVNRTYTCDTDSGECPQQIIPTGTGLILVSDGSIMEYVLEDNSGNPSFSRYDVDLATITSVAGLTYNPVSRYIMIYGTDKNGATAIAYASYNGKNELSRSTDVTADVQKVVDLSDNQLVEGFVLRGETYLLFNNPEDPSPSVKVLPTYREFSVDGSQDGAPVVTISRDLTLGTLVENTELLNDNVVSFLVDGDKLLASGLKQRLPASAAYYSNSFIVGQTQLCELTRDQNDKKTLEITSCDELPDYEFPGLPVRFYNHGAASYQLISGKLEGDLAPPVDGIEYEPTPYEKSVYGGLVSYEQGDDKTFDVDKRLEPQICNYTPNISDSEDDDVARRALAKKRFCYQTLPDNVTAADYCQHIGRDDCTTQGAEL